MALFTVTVRKGIILEGSTQAWTNVYHVEADDIPDALDKGVTIANIEQGIYKDYVVMSRVNARLAVTPTTESGRRELTGAGDITGDETKRLPGFNAVRCTFSDEIGRPDQKYLRLPLEEDDVVSGTINVTVNNLIQLDYVSEILALPFIRSSDNALYTEGTVIPAIQMRQLSWHRRSRPGFHRAYVPNS